MNTTPKIAILGAGMSGLGMAMQLRRADIHNFTIYEKADAVGGTWRENTYPGVACDVPSHLYSFSFEPNSNWSHTFSPGAEIWQYTEHCADKYELRPHLRLGHELEETRFTDGRWYLRFANGHSCQADVVISALGGLHIPSHPDIPGAESFAGDSFHSAQWNHSVPLAGRRVLVLGSAASAVQLVPEIAAQVSELAVFQRTANWLLPRNSKPYSRLMQWLFTFIPPLRLGLRWLIYWTLENNHGSFSGQSAKTRERIRKQAVEHLHEQVPDPELRARLTPEYEPGCKRMMVSDDYYPALQRSNVNLVTSPIARIVPEGIETEDGTIHAGDVLIYATGFKPFNMAAGLSVIGSAGQDLNQVWGERIETHQTLSVPDFPNYFLLLGPNSGLGHNSVIFMIEVQIRYIIKCLRHMMRNRKQQIVPTEAATRVFNTALQQDMSETVWQQGGCRSWYKTGDGFNYTLWPRSTVNYWRQLRNPNFDEYELR